MKKINEELYNKVVEMYRNGVNCKKIANGVGISQAKVCYWARKAGIPVRNKYKFSKEVHNKVIEDYRSGKPVKIIAYETGMSGAHVVYLVRKSGIKQRNYKLTARYKELSRLVTLGYLDYNDLESRYKNAVCI